MSQDKKRQGLFHYLSFLGGALRDFDFIIKIIDCPDLGCIWHLGGFGRMENTPGGHADDLPAILGISKMTQNREMSTVFSAAGFCSKLYIF